MQSHLTQERRYASPSFAGQQGPDRRRQIAHRGIQANAPGQIALQTRFSAIRRVSSIYERYREWDIENFFNKLKHFRAVATRFEKHDANYLALVKLAAAKIWMRFIESVSSTPPPVRKIAASGGDRNQVGERRHSIHPPGSSSPVRSTERNTLIIAADPSNLHRSLVE